MKKLSLVLIMIFAMNCTAMAQSDKVNPLDMSEEHYQYRYEGTLRASAGGLRHLGLASKSHVEMGWNNISRRAAFEMLYLTYTCSTCYVYPENDKQIDVFKVKDGIDWFEDAKPDTYDNLLATNLMCEGLAKGRKQNAETGKYIVELDSDMTYYEALTAITNMFVRGYEDYERWYIKETVFSDIMTNSEYPRYELAKAIGLINQNDILYSTLEIDMDKLNQPISAYEYMHLLYSAMFIPYVFHGDYGINPGYEMRLIDYFLEIHYDNIRK